MPFSLALLLTFVLTPPVVWLQRRIGRVPAVLTVVILVFTFLGLAGWGVVRQMSSLSADLPTYRANIRAKARDIQRRSRRRVAVEVRAGDDRPAARLRRLGSRGHEREAPRGQVRARTGFSAMGWLGPVLGPLGTALRWPSSCCSCCWSGRICGTVCSASSVTAPCVTTKALDEAGTRVSRQLLMQTVVNIIYGAIAAAGCGGSACRIRFSGEQWAPRCASFPIWARCRAPRADPHQRSRRCPDGAIPSKSPRSTASSRSSPTSCSRPRCTRARSVCRRSR